MRLLNNLTFGLCEMSALILPHDFYVYVHRRRSDTRVFYVGKGRAKRAWEKNRKNSHWQSVVKKHGLCVEIVQSGMQEWWAFELERELIAFYGRDNLCNFTDGGEGSSGYVQSEQTKIKKTIAQKNAFSSLESKAKRSIASSLRLRTDSEKEKLRIAQTGKKYSDESRQKMSLSKVGKKLDESKRKNFLKAHGARSVQCVETLQIFDSFKSAARWLNSIGFLKATGLAISVCCKNNKRTAYGYKWTYF